MLISNISSKRNEITRKIKTVSSVPASAVQAIKVLQDPNASMGEVVQIIAYDPGLTSNILKLANSSYFGCARAISSLKEAVVRLGSANIFKIVTASMANTVLNSSVRGYNYKPGELWEHSIAVAVASETMAEILKDKNAKLAFTAGLLHDIGKVLLGRFIDKETIPAMEKALTDGKSSTEAEHIAMGIDHAELGAMLLRDWNIPENLVQAVRWHHTPLRDGTKDTFVSGIINTSDCLCIASEIGIVTSRRFKPVPDPVVCARLSLSTEMQDEIVLRTKSSLDNIKDVFSKRD